MDREVENYIRLSILKILDEKLEMLVEYKLPKMIDEKLGEYAERGSTFILEKTVLGLIKRGLKEEK